MTPCNKIDIENIVKTLTEDTSIEEILKSYIYLSKLRGGQQAEQGELLDHAEVEKRLERCLN